MRESVGPVHRLTPSVGATATVVERAGHLLVTVEGEVDANFEAAGAAVIDRVARGDLPVDVDLSGVTFFCAAGVAWLARLRSGAPDEVVVVAMSAHVREVLDLCSTSPPASGQG